MIGDRENTPPRPAATEATRVDRICDRFEGAWACDERPSIADYLRDVHEPFRSRLFEELLRSDIECRKEAGIAVDVDDYVRQFPDRARQISAVLADVAANAQRDAVAPATQVDATAVNAFAAGTRYGNYEIISEIARGGMGVVFQARDVRLQRTVALKMILDRNLASAEAVQRFRAEAEMAAALDHPGIVPVYDVGSCADHHYYAMGYVEGPTLAAQLKCSAHSIEAAAQLVLRIAQAVSYAHEHGVVHRDLKPGNILLGSDGQPRITDFGLAKRTDRPSHLTMEGQILGTPGYMAPEQVKGDITKLGAAVDIYAIGAILYHVLTGHPPFRATFDALVQVLEQDPIPPRVLNRRIPRDLNVICMKCLAKNPADRYATAAELSDDIARFLEREPIQARPLEWHRATLRWARHRPRLATVWTTLTAIYIYHLICYATGNPGSLGVFHWLATGAVAIAVAYAWIYQRLLLRPEASMRILHLWAATDIVMFTVFLIAAADGPHSPLVVLYLCMVASTALSFDRHMVWLVTGVSLGAYGLVVVLTPYVQPRLPAATFRETAPVAISMLAIGLVQYYVLRCARMHETKLRGPTSTQ